MNTKKITTLFFDLDGTLSDSREGIVRSFNYALEKLGREPLPEKDLASRIGPAMREMFGILLSSQDSALIERATTLYRERYEATGMFENTIYPGVPEMLGTLRSSGYTLYIVTSKPRYYAEKIIAHFGLSHYFAAVYGPELDGRFDNKQELLEHILTVHALNPDHCVMIGDRSRDIDAAKPLGIWTIGVTYGFGSREELHDAEILAESAEQLCAILKRS